MEERRSKTDEITIQLHLTESPRGNTILVARCQGVVAVLGWLLSLKGGHSAGELGRYMKPSAGRTEFRGIPTACARPPTIRLDTDCNIFRLLVFFS
jgi:hypothetical protein